MIDKLWIITLSAAGGAYLCTMYSDPMWVFLVLFITGIITLIVTALLNLLE